MRKLVYLIMLFFTINVFSQTGKEIIEKNIEKSGGVTAWKLLNSIELKGNITLSLSEEFPIEIQQARPKFTKTSIWVDGEKRTIEGFDGKKGYEMDYAKNKLVENKSYKAESFDNDFIDFENKGFKAKFIDKVKINGRLAFKVQLVKNVNTTMYYFDTENYFLLREEKNGETLDYSNYKKVGKLFFAFRIEGTNPVQKSEYVMILKEIKTNIAFPKNTFYF